MFFAKLDTACFATDYTLSINEGNMPMNTVGTLTMHGDKFIGTIFDNEAAYDGQTLYVYQPESNELMLTTPTEDELRTSNPLRYAKSIYRDYKLDIQMDQQTGMPQSIAVRIGTRSMKVVFRNPRWLKTPPEFKIDKKDAYFVDLR